jgi:hypothetical protein
VGEEEEEELEALRPEVERESSSLLVDVRK